MAIRPARKPKPEPGEGAAAGGIATWLKQFWADLTKNTVAIVIGVVLAGGSSAAVLAWNNVNALVDGRVADAFTLHLAKPDSQLSQHLENFLVSRLGNSEARLTKSLTEMLDRSIKTSFDATVGALSAGRILLTAAAPAQSIYVYAPKGHKVRLLLKVKNLGEGDSVRVMSRNGKPMLVSEEGPFDGDVTAFLDSQANDAAIAEMIELSPSDSEFKNLYSLRIQLASATPPPSSPPAIAPNPTEVEYMTFVTPAISLGGS